MCALILDENITGFNMGKISTIDTAFICDNISGSQNAVQIFAKTLNSSSDHTCWKKIENDFGKVLDIFDLPMKGIFGILKKMAFWNFWNE